MTIMQYAILRTQLRPGEKGAAVLEELKRDVAARVAQDEAWDKPLTPRQK